MDGDIAFAGLLLTADEWAELDGETRDALLDVAMRRFPSGTEPPYPGIAKPMPEAPSKPVTLADGSGPTEADYFDFGDLND